MHRLRALVLLGRFLDMGAWAVDLALSGETISIFSLHSVRFGCALIGVQACCWHSLLKWSPVQLALLGVELYLTDTTMSIPPSPPLSCSRHLPLRAQAAADDGHRPAPDAGAHLG